MATPDYTASQALETLMRKLVERDKDLGAQIQDAIDAGKDVEETDRPRGRRKKPRTYRKAVRFTDEEALRVALDGLRAYFVEQPLFIESAADEFKAVALGPAVSRIDETSSQQRLRAQDGIDHDKVLEIELRTETQILGAGQETIRLERPSSSLVDEQESHLKRLDELVDFSTD